jgi:hypothetical protein
VFARGRSSGSDDYFKLALLKLHLSCTEVLVLFICTEVLVFSKKRE